MMKIGLMDGITGNFSQKLENMLLPGFTADISSDETLDLKKNYLADRQTILDFYSTGEFLEKTLKKLTEK
jgi:hypothetical protein